MTSSAKQTETVAAEGEGSRQSGPPISPALAGVLIAGVLLLMGWAVILHSYHWHLGAPAVFLFIGWGAILLSARFLWQSAWAAATEPRSDTGDDFWRPVGKREELLAEKKALIKAIKEVEFDHDMGKMSDGDAGELTRYYRLRAIEVIKSLDSGGDDASLPTAERIKRDVEVRLALRTGAGPRARASTPAANAQEAKAAPPSATPETDEAPADEASTDEASVDEAPAEGKE